MVLRLPVSVLASLARWVGEDRAGSSWSLLLTIRPPQGFFHTDPWGYPGHDKLPNEVLAGIETAIRTMQCAGAEITDPADLPCVLDGSYKAAMPDRSLVITAEYKEYLGRYLQGLGSEGGCRSAADIIEWVKACHQSKFALTPLRGCRFNEVNAVSRLRRSPATPTRLTETPPHRPSSSPSGTRAKTSCGAPSTRCASTRPSTRSRSPTCATSRARAASTP